MGWSLMDPGSVVCSPYQIVRYRRSVMGPSSVYHLARRLPSLSHQNPGYEEHQYALMRKRYLTDGGS